ncbi:MAG TPA: terpene cyclase/mutase family protein [Planctomycetota bacterium]|nr:terpene cyclase/mutase family protein [Planctomycetota bacterium]HRR79392.1 terpene cyclase/mutase family protein [Planctomycetota bacterium]HRT96609.1 terpene cyclase/mutase family protein [Planctomycetota bacterium]
MRTTRRMLWFWASVACAASAGTSGLPKMALSEKTRQVVLDGLRYLARTQNRDGSWSGRGGYSRNVGVSALACMAFMANGSQPGRGEFGENIDRGLDFILSNVRRDGYISAGADSRMYEHGFATLFLGEAYGMTQRPDIADKLRLAVALIQRSQKHADGGWRYDPSPLAESDISVTVCQIMALRSARNAGIKVPKECIDRAVNYVKQSCLPDGSFCYMLHSRSRGSYALLSAGVSSLYGAGEFDCPELKRALALFEQETPRNISHRGPISHYYSYAHYYASQAAYHAGGRYWSAYYPAISKELTETQEANGSWQDTFGEAYGTAMACLVLQLPYQYLPIFQRLGAEEAALLRKEAPVGPE